MPLNYLELRTHFPTSGFFIIFDQRKTLEMTGVVTDNFKNFLIWCKDRKITRYTKEGHHSVYVDHKGEQYVNIQSVDDVRGRHFTEIEIVDWCPISFHLINVARSRVRN